MKKLLACLLFHCLLLQLNAFDGEDEAIEDCFDEDLQLFLRNGDSITPKGYCQRLTCFGNGFIYMEPCRTSIPPGCKVYEADLTKEYPSCCPHIECPDRAEMYIYEEK